MRLLINIAKEYHQVARADIGDDVEKAIANGIEIKEFNLEDFSNFKDEDGNCLDDLILDILQKHFDCGNTWGYGVAYEIIKLFPNVLNKMLEKEVNDEN